MHNIVRNAAMIAIFSACAPFGAHALPMVEADVRNPVPACVTPQRLMGYLKTRNPRLEDRLGDIAAEYRRQGQLHGVRWDYAFFQMIVETGNLTYRRADGSPGRVEPAQYNFAAIGVRENGAPGNRFLDVQSGVRAHVRKLAAFARQRQDFADLARQWAPDDRNYADKIEAVARRFFDTSCSTPAVAPELVAAVRTPQISRVANPDTAPAQAIVTLRNRAQAPVVERSTENDWAQRTADRERDQGTATRAGLGAIDAQPGEEIGETAPVRQSPAMPPEARFTSGVITPASDGTKVAGARAMAAVAALPKPEPVKRVDPADDAVRNLVSGRTILLDTPVGSQIPIAFREDGGMRGQAGDLGSYLGAAVDEGKWWVSRGRLCQRWKIWFDKETQCLTLRQSGQIVHWSSDKGKSGTARIAPRS